MTTLKKKLKAAADPSQAFQKKTYYRNFYKNAQAALVMLADTLQFQNMRFYTKESMCTDPSKSYQAMVMRSHAPGLPPDGLDRGWVTAYKTFVPIVSEPMFPPDVAVSLLVSRGEKVNKFFTFELTSAQQSALVPTIRLYKVHYGTRLNPTTGLWESTRIPKGDPSEIVFDAYTKTSDVTAILNNKKGKIPGHGIKSFDWALKGVNPADVDANITATLKMYFNDVQDVLSPSNNQPGGTASFLNLILFSPPMVSSDSGSGKVNPPPPCQNETFEGHFFEIKVELGWAVPPPQIKMFTSSQREYIQNAKEILYLQLTEHEFDFKADGSSELTVKYRARKQLTDNRYDLLSADSAQHMHKDAQQIRDLLKDDNLAKTTGWWGHTKRKWKDWFEMSGENSWNFSDQITEDSLKDELASLTEKKNEELKAQNKRFLSHLLQHNCYYVHVPHALLLQDVDSDNTTYNLDNLTDAVDTLDEGDATILAPKTLYSSVFGPADPDEQTGFGTITPAEAAARTEVYNKVLAPIQQAFSNFTIGTSTFLGPTHYGRAGGAVRGGPGSTFGFLETQLRDDFMNPDEDIDIDIYANETHRHMIHKTRRRGPLGGGPKPVESYGGLTEGDPESPVMTRSGAWVSFFYLGDILESLLTTTQISQDISMQEIAFVTTDMQFLNTFKIVKGVQKDTYEPASAAAIALGAPPASKSIKANKYSAAKIKCELAKLSQPGRRKYMSYINLANIPINAEAFLDFYKRKIINDRKLYYYLGDFLADIFTEFLRPAMADNGLVGFPPNNPVSFMFDVETSKSALIFAKTPRIRNTTQGAPASPPPGPTTLGYAGPPGYMDASEHEHQPYYHGRGDQQQRFAQHLKFNNHYGGQGGGPGLDPITQGYTIAAPVTAYVEVENPRMAGGRRKMSRGIFPREPVPKDRALVKILNLQIEYSHLNGDYDENIERGIPNFVVGIDRGIIKKVEFRRVDQKYLREARLESRKGLGTSQLRELYHCNLTLYGNTLLTPGQLIYVEPNPVVFGRPTQTNSTARILGLGGYHLVIEVSNYISEIGWETKVRALHVAMPSYDPPKSS